MLLAYPLFLIYLVLLYLKASGKIFSKILPFFLKKLFYNMI